MIGEKVIHSMTVRVLINKLYIKSNALKPMRGFALWSSKTVNCNQIIGHVADRDYIEFID